MKSMATLRTRKAWTWSLPVDLAARAAQGQFSVEGAENLFGIVSGGDDFALEVGDFSGDQWRRGRGTDDGSWAARAASPAWCPRWGRDAVWARRWRQTAWSSSG